VYIGARREATHNRSDQVDEKSRPDDLS